MLRRFYLASKNLIPDVVLKQAEQLQNRVGALKRKYENNERREVFNQRHQAIVDLGI